MSFRKLGQLDLYIYCSKFLGPPTGTICPMEPVGVGFVPGPLENGMPL